MKRREFKIGDTVICIGNRDVAGRTGWKKNFIFKIDKISTGAYQHGRVCWWKNGPNGVYSNFLELAGCNPNSRIVVRGNI